MKLKTSGSLFIFLILFRQSFQLIIQKNLKDNLEKRNEFRENINFKDFIITNIGTDNWLKINNILDPLGEKWKGKILSIVYILSKFIKRNNF